MRDTLLWVFNLVAAAILFVLLVVHMVTMHLPGVLGMLSPGLAEPMSWDSVMGRAGSGMQTVAYLVLLAVGLFHGLYGLRTMLIEYWSGARAARLIGAGCVAAGVVLFAIGTATTVYFHYAAG